MVYGQKGRFSFLTVVVPTSYRPTSGSRRWESAVANDFKVARHWGLEGTFTHERAYYLNNGV